MAVHEGRLFVRVVYEYRDVCYENLELGVRQIPQRVYLDIDVADEAISMLALARFEDSMRAAYESGVVRAASDEVPERLLREILEFQRPVMESYIAALRTYHETIIARLCGRLHSDKGEPEVAFEAWDEVGESTSSPEASWLDDEVEEDEDSGPFLPLLPLP